MARVPQTWSGNGSQMEVWDDTRTFYTLPSLRCPVQPSDPESQPFLDQIPGTTQSSVLTLGQDRGVTGHLRSVGTERL